MLPETLGELLQVPVIVGLVTAFILEKWAWYQALTPPQKLTVASIVTFGAGVLIAAVSAFVPQNVFDNADQWYQVALPLLNMILSGLVTFAASQTGHVAYRAVKRLGDRS